MKLSDYICNDLNFWGTETIPGYIDVLNQESGIIVKPNDVVIVGNWRDDVFDLLDDDEYEEMMDAISDKLADSLSEIDSLDIKDPNLLHSERREACMELIREYLFVERVADIRDYLPGSYWADDDCFPSDRGVDTDMSVAVDDNDDLPALWGLLPSGDPATDMLDADGNVIPIAGNIYRMPDGTILIAPEDWN